VGEGLGGRRTGREKDWVGGLTAAVEDEEDPLYCIRASTERRLSDQRDNGYTASSLPHRLNGLGAPKRSLSLTSDARHGPAFDVSLNPMPDSV
jgi:hypothetical protein